MVRTVGKPVDSMSPIDAVNHQLICTQLILLLSHADFSDFAGKSRLNEAVKTFLAQPQMEHYFEPLVRAIIQSTSHTSEGSLGIVLNAPNSLSGWASEHPPR